MNDFCKARDAGSPLQNSRGEEQVMVEEGLRVCACARVCGGGTVKGEDGVAMGLLLRCAGLG